jgi:hypothetical protein
MVNDIVFGWSGITSPWTSNMFSVCAVYDGVESYKQQALLRGLISSLFSGTDSSLDEFDKIKGMEEKLGTLVRVLLE